MLSLRPHRIVQEILIREAYALLQISLIGPTERSGFRHVEQFAGSAIGFCGIPLDFALIADNFRHKFSKSLYGQFLSCSGIHRLVTAVIVHQKHAQVRQVVHVEKLTQRAAVAPAGNLFQSGLFRLVKTADKCR